MLTKAEDLATAPARPNVIVVTASPIGASSLSCCRACFLCLSQVLICYVAHHQHFMFFNDVWPLHVRIVHLPTLSFVPIGDAHNAKVLFAIYAIISISRSISSTNLAGTSLSTFILNYMLSPICQYIMSCRIFPACISLCTGPPYHRIQPQAVLSSIRHYGSSISEALNNPKGL